MLIVQRPRAGGKTTQMVAWLKADLENRVLIVHSEAERRRILDKYGLEDRVLSANNAEIESNIRGLLGYLNRPEVGVDNIDLVLNAIFGNVTIGSITP